MNGKRFLAALLVVLMVLSAGTVPAQAALVSAQLPDLAAFLGSKYTQNEQGTYTNYVTCTYSDSLGTEPLEEFLELLQEDRYHLKLIKTGKDYQDGWDPAGTCRDYFFEYTGSFDDIQWITTKSGDKYHVKVTLHTYTNKDYNAIVFYREPHFTLADSGVRLGDKGGKEIPALDDFFGNARRKEAENGETAYFFDYSTEPSTRISDFAAAMKKLDLKTTGWLDVGSSGLQLFHVDETVVITLWWHDGDGEVEVILHDDALKAAGYGQKTIQVKNNTATGGNSGGGSSNGSGGSSSPIGGLFDTLCFNCSGTGEAKCSRCVTGSCVNCGGDGYITHYAAGKIKKVDCSACTGGRCRNCGGDARVNCPYC